MQKNVVHFLRCAGIQLVSRVPFWSFQGFSFANWKNPIEIVSLSRSLNKCTGVRWGQHAWYAPARIQICSLMHQPTAIATRSRFVVPIEYRGTPTCDPKTQFMIPFIHRSRGMHGNASEYAAERTNRQQLPLQAKVCPSFVVLLHAVSFWLRICFRCLLISCDRACLDVSSPFRCDWNRVFIVVKH